ncbi:hypothetical protein DFH07DRAFT_769802 [Mycena maculata]|uniref:Uncharacterized protein n=1 Tax=Mycena maculata TaxID=230809 RepID=A0AAD7JK62_9AGAR|nr:hypothetical protein DFH07DRAFT_769802 [Mycena maculata]
MSTVLYRANMRNYARLRSSTPFSELCCLGLPYMPFEGSYWFPIDVDSGTPSNPIDLEWWLYVRGVGVTEAAQHGLTVVNDHNIFKCCICLDTLYRPVMLKVVLSVAPMSQKTLFATMVLKWHYGTRFAKDCFLSKHKGAVRLLESLIQIGATETELAESLGGYNNLKVFRDLENRVQDYGEMYIVADCTFHIRCRLLTDEFVEDDSDLEDDMTSRNSVEPPTPKPYLMSGPQSGIKVMPIELRTEIIKCMDLAQLVAWGTTCYVMHEETNSWIHRHISNAFKRWGLDCDATRYMLTFTESLVSGYWANELLFPGLSRKAVNECDTMDLFVRFVSERAVIRWFKLATGWLVEKKFKKPSNWYTEGYTIPLEQPLRFGKRRILLHIIPKGDPITSVFRQDNTAKFVTMNGNGISVAYSDLTFKGVCLANHACVASDNASVSTCLNKISEGASAAGFDLKPYHYTTGGECHGDISCPKVLCSSVDAHSFNMVFRTRGWGVTGTKCARTGVSWCLGAKGCGEDVLAMGFFVHSVDVEWKDRHNGQAKALRAILEERVEAKRSSWWSEPTLKISKDANGKPRADMFGLVIGEYNGMYHRYIELASPVYEEDSTNVRWVGKAFEMQMDSLCKSNRDPLSFEVVRDGERYGQGGFDTHHGFKIRVQLPREFDEDVVGRVVIAMVKFTSGLGNVQKLQVTSIDVLNML